MTIHRSWLHRCPAALIVTVLLLLLGSESAASSVALLHDLDIRDELDGNLLENAADVAVHSDGTIYVSGRFSSIYGPAGDQVTWGNVLVVDGEGAASLMFDVSVIGGPSPFHLSTGRLDVDSTGDIIVADQDSAVFRVTSGTAIPIPAGIPAYSFGEVHVEIGPGDDVFLTDVFNSRVLRLTSSGAVVETFDGHAVGLFLLAGLAVGPSGDAYVSAELSSNAAWCQPAVGISEIIDAAGDGAGASLASAGPVATDASGNVYVAGVDSDNVFKIAPGGAISEVLSAADALDRPIAMEVDAAGNLYVAGRNSNNILQVSPSGSVREIVAPGDGGGPGVGFYGPRAMDLGSEGDLYVVASYGLFRITPTPPDVPTNGPDGVIALASLIAASGLRASGGAAGRRSALASGSTRSGSVED